MIKARHNGFYIWFLSLYTRLIIKGHFREVNIHGKISDEGKPVLMIGNHFSWWDGFIAQYINLKLLEKKFHVMMLEDELRKRMFLNKSGAFSVRKSSQSVRESLDYAAGILKSPGNLLLFYPQGEIQSSYHYPVRFDKGIQYLLNRVREEVQLVLYVALIDYFSHRKPQLDVYLKEQTISPGSILEDLENAFNDFLIASIKQQKE